MKGEADPMENTYTFTARHAEKPGQVVTFTLHDSRLAVDLGPPVEQFDAALEGEADVSELREQLQPQLRPMAVALVGRGLRPIHIGDVEASAEEEALRVQAWIRAGALRLLPITFDIDPVDNPDASRAFVDELDARKSSVPDRGRMPGPLDYWVGWMMVLLWLAVPLLIWRRSRNTSQRR
jgi:hypothetical protein